MVTWTYYPPRTWSTGDIWQASSLNHEVRDDLTVQRSAHPVLLYQVTQQSLPTTTTEVFGSAILFDGPFLASTVDGNTWWYPGQPSRLNIPVGLDGYFDLIGRIAFFSGTLFTSSANLRVNGTTMIARNRQGPTPNVLGWESYVQVETLYHLSAGDYVELGAAINSAAVTQVSGNTQPDRVSLSARWMGA